MQLPRVTRALWLVFLAAPMIASCSAPAVVVPTSSHPSSLSVPADTPAAVTTSTRQNTVAPPVRSSTVVVTTPTSGQAMALLSTLAVKGRAPKTGYTRAQFGDAWTDDVTVDGGHNGCDTRNDVLRRDLTAVAIKAGTHGCVAATGTLQDPYTGRVIAFVRGTTTSTRVQIDHVVALSDAWQTGAQALSASARHNLANDPLELLAVDGPTNEAKGDGDTATWLPPNKSFRCAYVARQIAVKSAYHLWVTAAERAAMVSVLTSCPGQPIPTAATIDIPVLVAD